MKSGGFQCVLCSSLGSSENSIAESKAQIASPQPGHGLDFPTHTMLLKLHAYALRQD